MGWRQQYPNDIENEPLKLDFIREMKSLLNSKTLYKICNNIIYGWLKKEMDKVDTLRFQKWILYYNIDASARTIPHKFGPQSHNNMKKCIEATDSHIVDIKYGYSLWQTRMLEKGGESHQKTIVEQLGSCIAENMTHLEEEHKPNELFINRYRFESKCR